jgi:hypothetical protein
VFVTHLKRPAPAGKPASFLPDRAARRSGVGQAAPAAGRFSVQTISVLPPVPQARIRVGEPDSPLEREADAVAERVVGQAAQGPTAAGSTTTAGMVQRAYSCAGGDGERTEEPGGKRADDDEVLGKLSGPAQAMTAETDTGVRALAGGGTPLPPGERAFFEPRLGHRFGDVRVHTDETATATARRLGARAFSYGRDIAFAPGEYAPGTDRGRRLLAHELAHVIQQSRRAEPTVQRDLATPPPAVPPAAQPDLTKPQLDEALRFNRARYDAVRTKLIQDLVGTTPTGTWTDDDIVAIAAIQEEYGLTKDGKVGFATFRFLDEEVRREHIPRTDPHCLLSFRVEHLAVADGGHVAGNRDIRGHFEVHLQFSRTCGCADYEYRQFIRGHALRRPAGGGAPIDLAPLFTIPGGGLPAAFAEDGDITAAVVHYGHRADAGEAAGPVNRYVDDVGVMDQAAGCRYDSDDFPGGPFPFAPGDELDLDINFRGQVERGGRVVQTLHWTGLRGRFR